MSMCDTSGTHDTHKTPQEHGKRQEEIVDLSSGREGEERERERESRKLGNTEDPEKKTRHHETRGYDKDRNQQTPSPKTYTRDKSDKAFHER